MTIDRQWLEECWLWFRGKRNAEKAKEEILSLFSTEPDEFHEWMKQDICEQSRKIIARWDRLGK
jgi:hypothetical protein